MQSPTNGLSATDSSKMPVNDYDIQTHSSKSSSGIAKLGPLVAAAQLASVGSYLYHLAKANHGTYHHLPNVFVAAQFVEFCE